ncbi:MAG: flippase-like domain-containing protein [Acidimicrobiales bacterium]|nr:flippase-like domain-containing protein [Acidimicrobiales bacterium]
MAEPIERQSPGAFSRGRVMMLIVSAIALYLVAPSLTEVMQAWPRLSNIAPGWFALMLGAQIISFAAVWYLQRLAFRDAGWFELITSQLASNAFSRVVPGGAAAGGALQFRMLQVAGNDPAAAAAALTAMSLMTTASLFVLPVLSIPAIWAGMPVPNSIAKAAWIGAGLFVALGIVTVVLARSSRLLRLAGRTIERIHPSKPGTVALPERLVAERDAVLSSIGRRWPQAAAASVAKWLFDFYALLAALVAVGDEHRVSLVLLAYVAGAVLTMVPITPGGLGFVEAGLTAALIASGVSPGRAVLATLAYRLVSYWLPILAGLGAYVWFRIHFHTSMKWGTADPVS